MLAIGFCARTTSCCCGGLMNLTVLLIFCWALVVEQQRIYFDMSSQVSRRSKNIARRPNCIFSHSFSVIFCSYKILFCPLGVVVVVVVVVFDVVMCRLFVPPSLVHSKFKSCLLTPSRFYKPFLLLIVPFIQLFYFSLLLLLPL